MITTIRIYLALLIDKIRLKLSTRNADREQFIRDHGPELGEQYAAEFWDKYH